MYLADEATFVSQRTTFHGSQLTEGWFGLARSVAVNQDAAAMAIAAEVEADKAHEAGLLSWLIWVLFRSRYDGWYS